jgi:hypothetical protein
MRYREYVAECIQQAFSGKLKTAELWTGIIAIVLSAIAYFWSPLGEVMSWLPAGLFALIFVLTFLFGLVRAPFRIHQQQEEICRRLQDQIDERKRRQRIVDKLAQLHEECVQLLMRKVYVDHEYNSWKKQIEDWYKRAQAEIEDCLGFSEMELFRTSGGTFFILSVQPFNERHQQDLQFFHNRQYTLRMLVDDMNSRLR